MGIFNLFKKKESRTNNELKNIDIKTLIENSKLINKQDLQDGVETLEVECKLEDIVLNAFDTVKFKLAKRNNEFIKTENGTVRIGMASFINKSNSLTLEQMEFVVTEILNICGVKDDNFTAVDKMRIKSGVWRGRWLLDGKFAIQLDKVEGFKLDIIGFHEL